MATEYMLKLSSLIREYSLYHVQTVDVDNLTGLLSCMRIGDPVGLCEPPDVGINTLDRLKILFAKNNLLDSVVILPRTKSLT